MSNINRDLTYFIKAGTLVDIADAIREKTGKTGNIAVSNYANEILNYTPIIIGTEEVEDGDASNYVEGTLYVVYEEA